MRLLENNGKGELFPNRRSRARVDEISKVRFKILMAREGEGFLQNLSERGGCLLLNEEVAPGSLIQLEINGLNGDTCPVRVIGRVKWQNGYLTGVEFLNE